MALSSVLIDQDEEALAFSHDFLLRRCLERGLATSQVRIDCIHFSVRQILKPRTGEEMGILDQVLKGSDFIYSVGLMDYLPDPVASKLIAALYKLVGDGGQLYIGNLVEAEDSTWLMDFVLAWHLVWRDPEGMRALAKGLATGTPRYRRPDGCDREVLVPGDPCSVAPRARVRRTNPVSARTGGA